MTGITKSEYHGATIELRRNKHGLRNYRDLWINGMYCGSFESRIALTRAHGLIDRALAEKQQPARKRPSGR